MVSRRNNENIKDLVLVGGALFLGYLILKSQGIIKSEPPTSTETSPECPRGKEYSKGYFQDCDPNYVTKFWGGGILQDTCVCLTQK